MGHKGGHMTLAAGVAAGAEIILLPEIPYNIDVVVKKIKQREKASKKFTIIAAAEGAISQEDAKLSKKKYKAKVAARNGASVVNEIAAQLQEALPKAEIRTAVIGHAQRGGNPDAYDREISTRFGIEGARLIMNRSFGRLVVMKQGEVDSIALEDTAGKLKYVNPAGKTVGNARLMGVTFDDM